MELLIVMFVLGLLALLLGGGCLCVTGRLTGGTIKSNAESQARDYIRQFHRGWEEPQWGCQRRDTNNDGYVRCTISGYVVEEGRRRQMTEQLECSAYVLNDSNRGCQTPRGIINTTQGGVSN